MAKTNAIYLGIDNMEEVEVVFSPKYRKAVQKIAKSARVPEVELLAKYLGQIDLDDLTFIAKDMKTARAKKGRR